MSEPFLGQVKLPFGMGRVPGWVLVPVIVIGIGLPAGYMLYSGSTPGPSPEPAPSLAPPPVCGDGELGFLEQCESEVCYESTLSTIETEICLDNVGCGPSEVCNPSNCTCQPENTCGNGVVEPNTGETCETNNMTACLSTQECIDCNCYFEVELAPFCGDNVAEGDEECDGSDTGICADDQACTQNCQCASRFIPSVCGDGILGPEEVCDYVDCSTSPEENCWKEEGCDDIQLFCDPVICLCFPTLPGGPAPPPLSDDPCEDAARVEILDVYDCSFDFDNNRWVYYEGKRCYDEAGNMTYDARNSEAKISEVWLGFCPNPLGNDEEEEPQEPASGRNPTGGP